MTRVPCIISQLLGFRFTNFWVTPCLYSLHKWASSWNLGEQCWSWLDTTLDKEPSSWRTLVTALQTTLISTHPPWWLQLTIILKKGQPPPERKLPIKDLQSPQVYETLCVNPLGQNCSQQRSLETQFWNTRLGRKQLYICVLLFPSLKIKKKQKQKNNP